MENVRFSNEQNFKTYGQKIKNGKLPVVEKEELTKEDCMAEFMYLGLRMMEGVSETEFQRQFGCAMDSIYGSILEKYRNEGFLQKRQEFWSLTEKGIHVSNYILADFLLDQ